ncbi:hypothetical protein Btru_025410 [Bulinus truncatus]|nr:hypothetical protein Btru_025410 [Bulinus truncatus]
MQYWRRENLIAYRRHPVVAQCFQPALRDRGRRSGGDKQCKLTRACRLLSRLCDTFNGPVKSVRIFHPLPVFVCPKFARNLVNWPGQPLLLASITRKAFVSLSKVITWAEYLITGLRRL